MKIVKSFIYPVLILSSVGYSAALTLQGESAVHESPGKRIKSLSKQELLIEHLPLQIRALQSLQGTFQSTIDDQKERNPLEAFKAACSLANIQTLIASTGDVLKCLQAGDQSNVMIGIGAAPAVKQEIDQLIVYLDAAGVACDSLKKLARPFQEITSDIYNPDLPTD